jgi:branched-chain amino acid transport system substrate-binding protein
MAAEEFHGGGKNIKVEIVYADHQNKADVGAAIARKWLDVEGVDAIVDVPNSAVGLTINSLLRDTRMTFLASSTANSCRRHRRSKARSQPARRASVARYSPG